MPLIEIDDQYAAQLGNIPHKDRSGDWRSMSEFQTAYNKILQGPQRLAMFRVIKAAYPDQVIPELDAAAPVTAEIEAIRKEFADYREEVKKEKAAEAEAHRKSAATDTIDKGRSWLRQQGCDDDGVVEVEKIMQDNNLANYEVAFSHYARSHPKTEPLPSVGFLGSQYDWFKGDEPDVKLLRDDPVGFKNAEVTKFFRQKAEGTLNLGTQ